MWHVLAMLPTFGPVSCWVWAPSLWEGPPLTNTSAGIPWTQTPCSKWSTSQDWALVWLFYSLSTLITFSDCRFSDVGTCSNICSFIVIFIWQHVARIWPLSMNNTSIKWLSTKVITLETDTVLCIMTRNYLSVVEITFLKRTLQAEVSFIDVKRNLSSSSPQRNKRSERITILDKSPCPGHTIQ